ncbi:hypothetical protein [Rufibacter immobilis]|uniref:hypothetical protein n=1 Tax=Rufibacter immobilis TaxID=1348778 RepID=UPI00161102B2|nr:hypothetical protein [Rufibacter immobilis]
MAAFAKRKYTVYQVVLALLLLALVFGGEVEKNIVAACSLGLLNVLNLFRVVKEWKTA